MTGIKQGWSIGRIKMGLNVLPNEIKGKLGKVNQMMVKDCSTFSIIKIDNK